MTIWLLLTPEQLECRYNQWHQMKQIELLHSTSSLDYKIVICCNPAKGKISTMYLTRGVIRGTHCARAETNLPCIHQTDVQCRLNCHTDKNNVRIIKDDHTILFWKEKFQIGLWKIFSTRQWKRSNSCRNKNCNTTMHTKQHLLIIWWYIYMVKYSAQLTWHIKQL